MKRIAITALCAALALSGCATSKSDFYSNPQASNTWSLCRALVEAQKAGDAAYTRDLTQILATRDMTTGDCHTRNTVVEIGAVVVVVATIAAAILAAGRNGGGGGGGQSDYDWSWDAFMAQNGQMTWACRGRQTGQFAEQWRCSGKPMNDYAWPGPNI